MVLFVNDFYLTISASDLVIWSGDRGEDCVGNPYLVTALNAIEINLDPVRLYNQFFDQTKVGEGDVYVYKNASDNPSYFIIDFYRELTDQLDIIQLAFRAKTNQIGLKTALRSFFDTASCQICYQEASICAKLEDLLSTGTYPKVIADSGYKQKKHEISDC